MTIARDIQTGAVIGQLVSTLPWNNRYRATIGEEPMTFLLTADGYKTVPASSVTLEKVS